MVPQPLSTLLGENLLVVCVTLHIKPELTEEFIATTARHCHESLSFHYNDYLKDPTLPCPSHLRFISFCILSCHLILLSRSSACGRMKLIQSCHHRGTFKFYLFTETEETLSTLRQTALYSQWTETIGDMLEKPRKSRKYLTVYSPLIRA
jgi:hypothetical protein